MPRPSVLAAIAAAALLAAVPAAMPTRAWAQNSDSQGNAANPPAQPPAPSAPSSSAPSSSADTGGGTTPSVGSATTETPPPGSNGTLGVASLTVKNGWRAGKMIGSSVNNDQNQQIGTVDDLILTPDNKVTVAVIQVGGFLGIGGKLVAVPFDRLHVEAKNGNDHIVLAGASKDALNAMPTFTYGNS